MTITTSYRQTISNVEVCERTSCQFVLLLTDAADVVITAGLNSLTLTLYEKQLRTIINGRQDDDILNTAGGVMSAGVLTLTLDPADNQMLTTMALEKHVALIEYTWDGGAKAGKKEVTFTVINAALVP